VFVLCAFFCVCVQVEALRQADDDKPTITTGCLEMRMHNTLLDTEIFTHKEIEQIK
jgi:hypothetical protein